MSWVWGHSAPNLCTSEAEFEDSEEYTAELQANLLCDKILYPKKNF